MGGAYPDDSAYLRFSFVAQEDYVLQIREPEVGGVGAPVMVQGTRHKHILLITQVSRCRGDQRRANVADHLEIVLSFEADR